MAANPNRLSQFWQELKRRKVIRTITVYAAAAFVILELLSIIIEPLRLPEWTLQFTIVFLCIGFIVAIILSWIYDIHPEGGIVKTEPSHKVKAKDVPRSSNGWKIASYISFAVIVGLIILNIIPNSGKKDILDKSIAVLPFDNRSENEEDAFFTDGIHDEIITQLHKISGLSIRGRTSVKVYRDRPKNLRMIGKELNVRYLLEGGVQRAGETVRINVQLIDAQTDNHLWSEIYDRSLSTENLFSIQSDIALRIASELKLQITPEEKVRIKSHPTENLEAYKAYLKGRYFLDKRTHRSILISQQHFIEAITIDSSYALAYSGLSDSYMLLGNYEALPLHETLTKAKSAIAKAIQLNPDLGEVQLSSAWVDLHLERGLADHHAKFEKAIELSPGYANAYHWYAWYLRDLREYDMAEKLLKEALELDPLSIVFTTSLGQLYLCQGKLEKAIQSFEQALELDLTYPRANNRIGQALVVLGKQELGIYHINLSIKYSERNPQYVATLALASGYSGQKDKAEQIVNDLIQMSEVRYVSNLDFAIAYFGQGNEEKGFEYLNKALENDYMAVANVLSEILLLYIHDHPEFDNIVRKVWPE